MLLGCIADDFTGATDLANNLVRAGMRTVQTIGVPDASLSIDADAVVVALKSRTIEPADAVAQSLAALAWLREAGCRQFYFKYCSTFDSTDRGNIGPVADALMDALGTDFTIACPAFPAAGRTIFRGHLFVGDLLLSDSGMRDHPLTPMTDANLVRVLQRQSAKKVGLLRYDTLATGVDATRAAIDALRADGVGIAIVDATSDADLMTMGEAFADLPLVTAGSGVAIGLPQNFRRAGLLPAVPVAPELPRVPGPALVLSGSCSQATLAQVSDWSATRPAYRVDPMRVARGEAVAAEAAAFARDAQARGETALVYASASPDEVRAVQQQLGRDEAGAMIERTLAEVARAMRESGTRRFVVAGGETSGAVVQALDVRALRIGPQIDPGVPWTETVENEPVALTLKSGNFGALDFFGKALALLDA
ncbi:four-carbon acid sugar kinase family protein [Burkholderiaceae bacterium FT117]|uniref:3-oxo-tetronate kinase n=1 Tax=Zeimonas sediminis TaxID=2944268 RepID=UPI002342F243|nr:3-oxo-tetronate kinase [Zeimonas sediminis]MCM5570217.1 four-carbon acid sugar kinase family protein [Zeimonas sediminis]